MVYGSPDSLWKITRGSQLKGSLVYAFLLQVLSLSLMAVSYAKTTFLLRESLLPLTSCRVWPFSSVFPPHLLYTAAGSCIPLVFSITVEMQYC